MAHRRPRLAQTKIFQRRPLRAWCARRLRPHAVRVYLHEIIVTGTLVPPFAASSSSSSSSLLHLLLFVAVLLNPVVLSTGAVVFQRTPRPVKGSPSGPGPLRCSYAGE
ncbi:hypothetical protein QYE76_033435 [Lolium multiflorum]|uniref:Uncharacterized protein n=1 Tax=Lolium multiflorum TaxID=4521 RepID=A0AAD8QXF0_LOLMU|nr:hypothetical protein QYE76_033435 [Lolium multiflorum]